MKLSKLFSISITSLIIFSCLSYKSYANENISKKVYLTFDDGPTCKNTPLLLDKLLELNIPATFFVVGKQINENPEIFKRIISEGHSIGLHTMTHEKNSCYSSQENFIKENIELRDKLKTEYNIETNILRFPFGSKNSYLTITSEFEKKLHNENFKIFDWHIDTCDALNPDYCGETILDICKNQLEKHFKETNNLIILLHTNNNNIHTLKAVPLIKEFFSNIGYEFSTLNNNSEEFYSLKK